MVLTFTSKTRLVKCLTCKILGKCIKFELVKYVGVENLTLLRFEPYTVIFIGNTAKTKIYYII